MAKTKNPHTEEIRFLMLEGHKMAEIARHFHLSRQRVKQIADTLNIPSSVEIRRKKKEEKYFLRWGSRDTSDLYVACRQKYFRKKANAVSAGHEFNIPFGHIEWVPTCPILGLELDYFAEKTQENSPSFDRIDPSKGYVTGNVLIVSWRANRIKNDGTSEEHERIAQYIRERQESL